jgi:hypothetical protein
LKFLYTEATRSTVGNISSLASPTITPNNLNETLPFERQTEKENTKKFMSLKNSKVKHIKLENLGKIENEDAGI